jgi:molecular chaperone DnaK (HSP70)
MNTTKNSTSDFKPSVIGVDLGSHFIKIAAVEKGVVDIITNEANLRQTPSVVGYGDNERLIGEAGQAKIKSNLANTVIAPQRYLGFRESEFTHVESKNTPCSPKYENGKLLFSVDCQGEQTKLLPEQVTAALFTKISDIIELNKLNSKHTVIAIPNYLSLN